MFALLLFANRSRWNVYSSYDGQRCRARELRAAYQRYNEYLKSLRDKLPDAAFAFATAPWHYNPQDPRCPHDAWLEHLKIEELAPNQEDVQHRYVAIHARLLGAYHDRYIELSKPKVLVGC